MGAGKSALGTELADLGAVRIDADVLAREVVEPGTPGLQQVLERFGPSALASDGSLDRAGLAARVFSDPVARADLNAIVHPLVARRFHELMAAAPESAVIVYEVPLLVETARTGEFDVVVVVQAPLATRLARLAERGLDEAAARSRISAQATDEQRRAVADLIVVNDRARADLRASAEGLWDELERRRGPA